MGTIPPAPMGGEHREVEGNYLEDHPRTGKWLGSPPFISHLGHLEGKQPYLGDLLTMVISHLLTGMILQVITTFSPMGNEAAFFLGGYH